MKVILFILLIGLTVGCTNNDYLIDCDKHHIIEGKHPSPLSARYNKKGTELSFFGHNYFNRCNMYLKSINNSCINWNKN